MIGMVAMSPCASAQVSTPITPLSSPPWSSLDVFDPVPFADLLSRNPEGAEAPEDTPVKTREHPGYERIGVRAGPWMIMPSVTGGVSYDNNVFASGADKQGDLAATVKSSLGMQSLWERHGIDIQGDVRSMRYRRFSQLDQTDASLRVRGRIDLWHDAAILSSLRVARQHEGVGSLTSPTAAAAPTPYDLASGDITYWQRFNRLAASIGVRTDYYNYGSTRARDGSIINQDSRDGRIAVAHGRFDYALTPALGLFTALEINRRDLRGTLTQALGSQGYRSLSGINVRFGHLVWGEFGAGYASQRFNDSTIGTIAGPAFRGMLTWSPTRMLDLHFKAEQIVTEASDTVVGGIKANTFQLGADYELRRNLVLSVAAVYERDQFYGQSRNDEVRSIQTELKYILNRHSSISLQHRYFRRDSSVSSASYDKHEVGVNVTARY
ncbi:MAG: outer membrane beta-barrel protein [Rhizobiales bacterium]|nr:outer membrane beta-barrel protein [Hyphomicrobiales bacterium]